MTYGNVKGYNQYGDYVTWPLQATPNHSFTTTGWYWVGWARVYYWNGSSWRSQAVYVPKWQYGSDITYARC